MFFSFRGVLINDGHFFQYANLIATANYFLYNNMINDNNIKV